MDDRKLRASISRRDHQIVQAEFEALMDEFLEADALQHRLQNIDGDAFLMLIALHLGADKASAAQHCQNQIDRGRRPGENQAPARCENAKCLTQNGLRLRQMLEDRKHHDVIKLRWFEWKRRRNVPANAPPAAANSVFDLVVDTYAV